MINVYYNYYSFYFDILFLFILLKNCGFRIQKIPKKRIKKKTRIQNKKRSKKRLPKTLTLPITAIVFVLLTGARGHNHYHLRSPPV